jgi:hypothetical protein
MVRCASALSRNGQRDFEQAVEDDERPGRPYQNDIGDTVVRSIERQLHSSSPEIGKALYSPRTTILRVLDNIGLHFFAPGEYTTLCPMSRTPIGASFRTTCWM